MRRKAAMRAIALKPATPQSERISIHCGKFWNCGILTKNWNPHKEAKLNKFTNTNRSLLSRIELILSRITPSRTATKVIKFVGVPTKASPTVVVTCHKSIASIPSKKAAINCLLIGAESIQGVLYERAIARFCDGMTAATGAEDFCADTAGVGAWTIVFECAEEGDEDF